MKSNNYLSILLVFLLISFTACDNKEDEPEDVIPTTGIGVFELLYVNNMAIDVSTNPSLVWEATTAADGSEVTYTLFADKAADLADGELPSTELGTDLSTNFYTVQSPLVSEEEYRWYVVATDADGESRSSTSVFTFTTGAVIPNQPPGPFNLLVPGNGEADVELDIALSWQASIDPEGDPVNYLVFFGSGANATGIIIANTAATSAPANGLAENTTYEWQVMAADDKGNITWCNSPFSFKTEGPFVPSPIIQTAVVNQPRLGATGNFEGVRGCQMAVLNGKIYDTGGFAVVDGSGREGNDVYSSTDGSSWTTVLEHDSENIFVGYRPSEEHQLVAYHNRLFVFDGNFNTIHESTDGVIWNNVPIEGSVIDDTHYLPRQYHQVVVYQDKLWLIGGSSGGQATTEVWVSEDEGLNWTKVKENDENQWPRGYQHQVVVLDDGMYLIGGQVFADATRSNEIWHSTDGATWTYLTTAPFAVQHGYQAAVYPRSSGDEIWVISGNIDNEVWTSTDGIDWTLALDQETNDMSYRSLHEAIFFDGKMWVFYGKGQSSANMRLDTWTFSY